jgi:hypothetical protein
LRELRNSAGGPPGAGELAMQKFARAVVPHFYHGYGFRQQSRRVGDTQFAQVT